MNINETLNRICSEITEIYPASILLEKIDQVENIRKEFLIKSNLGNPLNLYHFGNGKRTVLFYGYPDPGEGIGGTGILFLMRALSMGHRSLLDLDLTWVFIPCLNFDDQPDNGKSLEKVMKTRSEEVDWLLHRPRPETSALVDVIERFKPVFTFPMHDEFHCHIEKPVYFPVSHVIPSSLAQSLRDIVKLSKFQISTEFNHPEMGAGFFVFKDEAGEEMKNCTYSISAKYGLVFLCELYDHPGLEHKSLVQTQLEVGFKAMEWALTQS